MDNIHFQAPSYKLYPGLLPPQIRSPRCTPASSFPGISGHNLSSSLPVSQNGSPDVPRCRNTSSYLPDSLLPILHSVCSLPAYTSHTVQMRKETFSLSPRNPSAYKLLNFRFPPHNQINLYVQIHAFLYHTAFHRSTTYSDKSFLHTGKAVENGDTRRPDFLPTVHLSHLFC